jgi:glycosyltransferase involved in cell wall biosynthesis
VIVVDDGSDDGSTRVAEATDSVQLIRQRNRGPSAARNAGMRAATTKWVAFLDSDDVWAPHHLEVLLRHGGSSRALVSSSALTKSGRFLGPPRPVTLDSQSIQRLFWPDNPVVTSATMVDREVALDVGGFDTTTRRNEDIDLWLRVLRRRAGVALPDVTVGYDVHDGQLTANRSAMRLATFELMRRAVDSGSVDQATVTRIEVREHWDALRAGDPYLDSKASHIYKLLGPRRLLDLGELLRHRARVRDAGKLSVAARSPWSGFD